MNIADLLALAIRNLRQARLRTALTVMGVLVGVASIITMVSLGLGLQKNILKDALSRLDVFTTITVSGVNVDALLEMNESRGDRGEDSEKEGQPVQSPSPTTSGTPKVQNRVLDDSALAEIRSVPGVKFAVPIISFSSFLQFEGKTRRRNVGSASANPEQIPGFRSFLAGGPFSSDDAEEAIVGEKFAENFARTGRQRRGPFDQSREPEKTDEERARLAAGMIGKEITLLTAREVSPGSIFGIPIPAGVDSSSTKGGPGGTGDKRFEKHVFKIVGVLPSAQRTILTFGPDPGVLLPVEQAKRFSEANQDTLSQLGESLTGTAGYRQVTVNVVDTKQTRVVYEELRKRGFNLFPLPNLDDINRIFLFVDGALALIGGIALLVASFGISNTMIMSIRERTREIGIMKAIGGSNAEIMKIFFFEASLIGFLGGFLGVSAGWVITSLANPLVNKYLVKNPNNYIHFFSIPWYLWIGAVLFAVMVALAAALYPASQAAKVDPIKALRHD